MSEFKFNCPVCGQHIATDSGAAGAQIECPTCFQPIIVPQAPQAQSKYILSATQYIKPQPAARPPATPSPASPRPSAMSPVMTVLFFICAIGVVAYGLHSAFRHSSPAPAPGPAAAGDDGSSSAWRLNLDGVAVPSETASGTVHYKGFTCERAYLLNGTLALRQGFQRGPEMVVNVYFPSRDSQELLGKHFDIATNAQGPLPRVVFRWKERDLQVAQVFTNGYAMKLQFDSPADDKIGGRIYLCVPDDSRSVVAGTFTADLHKPAGPR